MSATQPGGPRGEAVACAACGEVLDALRAGHVAIFDGTFRFFCNAGRCRAAFVSSPHHEVQRSVGAETPVSLSGAPAVTVDSSVPEQEPTMLSGADDLVEPIEGLGWGRSGGPSVDELPEVGPSEIGVLLFALTIIAALMAGALEVLEQTSVVLGVRWVLLLVANATFAVRVAGLGRDPGRPPRWSIVSGPLVGLLVALWACLMRPVEVGAQGCFVGGTIVLVAAASLMLTVWLEARVTRWRRWAEGRASSVAAPEPGKLLSASADNVLSCDVLVTDGEGEFSTWWGAIVGFRPDDVILAGSRIRRGAMTGRCISRGLDVTLLRGMTDASRRPDVNVGLVRQARRAVQGGAVVMAATSGLLLALMGGSSDGVVLVVAGAYAAMTNVAIGAFPSLLVALGVQRALGHGVVYANADVWQRCSRVTATVFCARGTLLRGEPELVEIGVVSGRERLGENEDTLLGLAAAALAGQSEPNALAVRRAAASRKLTIETVRNPRAYPNRGVTAVTAGGESLCVGVKAFMLEQGVSVAVAEQRHNELERRGRSVLLVAREGRLIGHIAVQDGLRAGARAAVQHIIDVGLEPIFMSPDSRDTCEALGRALDIDHVRPEADDAAKADIVQRLQDAGARVALVGHAPRDLDALKLAHAPVLMRGAGQTSLEQGASTVTDDVRDAALAITLAQRTRRHLESVATMLFGGACAGVALLAFGVLPAEFAPLASGLAAVSCLPAFKRV